MLERTGGVAADAAAGRGDAAAAGTVRDRQVVVAAAAVAVAVVRMAASLKYRMLLHVVLGGAVLVCVADGGVATGYGRQRRRHTCPRPPLHVAAQYIGMSSVTITHPLPTPLLSEPVYRVLSLQLPTYLSTTTFSCPL